MKQFFSVLFGGIIAVAFGIFIAYLGSVGWKYVRPYFVSNKLLPALISTKNVDQKNNVPGTDSDDASSISGISRTVRYTAAEEEDIINAALQSLPSLISSKITADSYMLFNVSQNEVAIEHQADKILPIASLTKLVTAVVAKRNISSDKRVSITRQIMATYGNTGQFKVGETFTVKDLMYPLLMVSSNDAAEALAQSFGRRAFIGEMNDFVQSIGAYRTYFQDPSGLSPKNISTARDLSIITDWVRIHEPDILSLTREKTHTMRAHTWINPTHFLNWSNYLGGKNGYTPEANRTGISLFTLGKKKDTYIIIVLGSEGRDADVIRLMEKVN